MTGTRALVIFVSEFTLSQFEIPQKFVLYFHLFLSANERVVIDFSINGRSPGFLPDGLTIDTDGNLYISNFGSSNILKVDPK